MIFGQFLVLLVVSSGINIDKFICRLRFGFLDLFSLRRIIFFEFFVVVEYDSNNYIERVSDGESNRNVIFVSFDVRILNRDELNQFKSGSSIISENEIKESVSDSDGNSKFIKRYGSLGLILLRVVIEYDGVVVNDLLIDGYDIEEIFDEGKKMMLFFISEVQDLYIVDEIDNLFDGSFDFEDDIVFGDYGIFFDEEDVEDLIMRDEDGIFDDFEREKVEEIVKGSCLLFDL